MRLPIALSLAGHEPLCGLVDGETSPGHKNGKSPDTMKATGLEYSRLGLPHSAP